ncbi:TPA: YchJ family metal-binding protein, partial [Neisseria meningitidis]
MHLRHILPPTAEALMRSRYSAYVLHLIDYS